VAGDLLHERIPAPEGVASEVHELIRVRRMGQVVNGEDERLWEASELRFVRQGVFPDLFENFRFESGEVTFSSTSVVSNWRSSSRRSSCFAPVAGFTTPTSSPSLRKTPCIRTFELTETTS
jgi:hypothetical protein